MNAILARITLIVLSACGALILLTGCGNTPHDVRADHGNAQPGEPTDTSTGIDAISNWVTLPDGAHKVLCVYERLKETSGASGGPSCDWDHVVAK